MSTQAVKTDAEAVMREFFEICAGGDVVGAVERTMADDVHWTNTGFPDANGIEEAKALMQQFVDGFDLHTLTPEFRSVVSSGNTVAVERLEHMDDSKGNRLVDLPVMGTFEIVDGKIAALRDYFDPTPFLQQG